MGLVDFKETKVSYTRAIYSYIRRKGTDMLEFLGLIGLEISVKAAYITINTCELTSHNLIFLIFYFLKLQIVEISESLKYLIPELMSHNLIFLIFDFLKYRSL